MTAVREAFVGNDAAKLRNAVTVADAGRDGEIRYLGEMDASAESMRRPVGRLAAKYDWLHFRYEAGPTGYGLHRLITNWRDATMLARLLQAGELTAVWVPDPAHEAMRNLLRSRAATVETVRVHKQRVSAFLLRHSRIFVSIRRDFQLLTSRDVDGLRRLNLV